MPFSIEAALRRGIGRAVARNGLLIAGVLFVISTVNAIAGFGVARWIADRGFVPLNYTFPWELGTSPVAISPAIGAVVSVLVALSTIVLAIGALRTFVGDDRDQLRSEHFTQNMIWPGLNFLIGSIVFGFIIAFGLVLLIIPGLFLLVALAFWTVYVAVEDRNFVDGMRKSWGLTRGHRLRLFVLGFAVVLVELIVDLLLGIGTSADTIVGIVILQLGSALTTVFTLATLAAAYDQLVTLPPEVELSTMDSETPTTA